MITRQHSSESSNAIKSIRAQFSEDPSCEPHEFDVKCLHVLDDDGRERTVDCIDKVAADQSQTIVGVTGQLPVGAVTVGATRNSNSQANIVTENHHDHRENSTAGNHN